ncbi:MAG: hormogonium polysaccharide secretion pseudopilin HpsB [Nostoc sp. LLA-1]|nr:hormogonium polysaccharide secretion pseudopilin HpsB [Cyanocohniella sp. LLY]
MKLQVLPTSFTQSSESGFTIIESLVAIIVTSILLTAISPVLVISTATRVQSRRVELATQAAKTYIDGVQTKTIEPPGNPADKTVTLNNFATPTPGSLTCDANKYCTVPATPAKNLYCIDGNGNGKCMSNSSQDLVIQVFRYNKDTTDTEAGYQLGLRVYRADAFTDNTALKKNAPQKSTQATFTGGLGDRKAPLLEITTEINLNQPSYSNLCSRLGGCVP